MKRLLDMAQEWSWCCGEGEGWLWAVRLEDIAACALNIAAPLVACAHHPHRSI